jgi:hypothetical protein
VTPAVTLRSRGDGLHGPGVTISRAPNAHACGSPVCTTDTGLVRVELADRERPRVLCPHHADDYLARERGW